MKILFTGGSSFTGYWFVSELVKAGHDVVATLRQAPKEYKVVRAERVRGLQDCCQIVSGCSFGDDRFVGLIQSESFDVICHHAADVTDYKSPDFDFIAATENNTLGIRRTLAAFDENGGRRFIATGSIFEAGEGAGSNLRAFSPYGLSKGLSWQVLEFFAEQERLGLGKFVIPNPFGPFEEPRFTAYLMRTWKNGDTAIVNTPDYVRDNIHVSLLSKAYVRFVEELSPDAGVTRLNPSGYIESQGAFAQRVAANMAARLDLDCDVELAVQTEFIEPRIRVNTTALDIRSLGWSEAEAWDQLADYYAQIFDIDKRNEACD